MHPGILLQKYSKRFKFILQQRYNFSQALLKYRKYSNKRPGGALQFRSTKNDVLATKCG